MKPWYKWISIGLVATLGLSLTACSTSGSGSQADSKDVTITYARGKDVTPATQKMIEAFEKAYPHIKVNYLEMPTDSGQNHNQLVTMFNAGSATPDVFDMDVVWPAEFAQAGYLEPLDRYMAKDNINTSDYIQGAMQAGNFQGQQYAFPKYSDIGLLFYRKDLVKTPPKTWDELLAQGKQIQASGKTQFGYLMQAKQYEGLVCNFVEFIGSYGGSIIDSKGNVVINSPQSLKGLQEMIKVVQSSDVPKNITTFTEIESHTSFINGQSPFIRNWPYQYALANDPTQSKIVDKIGVAPLPAGDKGSVGALGGWLVGINKNSKQKQAAWDFLKFMTGPEGSKITAEYGGSAPDYLPAYQDPAVQKASPLFSDPNFLTAIKSAIPRPVTPKYQQVSEVVQIEVSKAISGKETAQQALQNMQTQIQQIVSSN